MVISIIVFELVLLSFAMHFVSVFMFCITFWLKFVSADGHFPTI